jgi:Protein of unknown function (DUF3644)
LQGSRKEALLAADLYNRPASDRSLAAFVVHMHLAWLYLLHARLLRDGIDCRYRLPNGRFERIDGDIKTWELARCLREAFPDAGSPVRHNVEFFIKLRNKIEHRYEPILATAVAGKAQALVLNYEEAVTEWFGAAAGLSDSLRLPVFISSLTPEAVETLKRTHAKLPRRITRFLREYDASVPEEVQSDWRYDFRVLLLPQTGPKTEADAVMRFVREDEMTDDQRRARDVVQTIVRTKQVPVANKGRLKPTGVADRVQAELGVRFSVYGAHTRCWRHFQVRPLRGASRPEMTDERYCVYDEPHTDYLYTEAWVNKLVSELADPASYERIVGSKPTVLTRAGADSPTKYKSTSKPKA